MPDSLDHPDLPAWHGQPDYSKAIAVLLGHAYRLIGARGGLVAAFLLAARAVQHVWDQSMADPQRLRICYVLALAYTADNQTEMALTVIEEGIELAEKLEDIGAIARLRYLRGLQLFLLLSFAEAAADFAESRLCLHALGDRGAPPDHAMELQLILHEAGVRSCMGQFDYTRALLGMARVLLATVPQAVLERATIAWLEANLLRWEGSPERALRGATEAAAIYTSLGAANSTVRIQVVTAEIVLDLVTTAPAGSDRDDFLRLARSHLSLASKASNEAAQVLGGDRNGEMLARLVEMRYQRLRGANIDRVRVIERLAREAQQMHDHALVAQALTTLADEFASQGERGSALEMYRSALKVLEGSDLRVLTLAPWRGIAKLDQLRI